MNRTTPGCCATNVNSYHGYLQCCQRSHFYQIAEYIKLGLAKVQRMKLKLHLSQLFSQDTALGHFLNDDVLHTHAQQSCLCLWVWVDVCLWMWLCGELVTCGGLNPAFAADIATWWPCLLSGSLPSSVMLRVRASFLQMQRNLALVL